MKTITPDQFKQMYGDSSMNHFDKVPEQSSSRGYFDTMTSNIGEDWMNRADRVGSIINNPEGNIFEKGTQILGQGAGAVANTVENLPIVKEVLGAAGKGINLLSNTTPIQWLGNKIGDNKALQNVVGLYDSNKNFKDTVDGVANMVRLYGDAEMAKGAVDFINNVGTKLSQVKSPTDVNITPDSGPPGSSKPLQIPTKGVSTSIMNNVARINPSDANMFKNLSKGKSVGEYLTETGNFGAPDKIISNEATKFTQSKASVDAELAKLPGVYKPGQVGDALNMLMEKAKSVSSENVPSPYLSEVQDLMGKYNAGGLTMDEINQVKRLFESNVKVKYNKLLNADKVEQATNIDSAIRDWQVKKASDLGFKNIADLNKQTQLSKFLVDKLGEKFVGNQMLNGVSLTDWIVLGGGTPTSIAGFLTKKFFSSRAVQAKIAELLNTGEPVKGLITPDSNPTPENIIRTHFTEGPKLELPAPKEGANPNLKQGNNPIPVGPASSIEPPAQKIMNESMINNSSKQELPPVSKKVKSTSNNSTIKTPKDAMKFIFDEAKKVAQSNPKLYDTLTTLAGEMDKNDMPAIKDIIKYAKKLISENK